jgi:acyl-coenzyme A thioesterase PaaI-like protein
VILEGISFADDPYNRANYDLNRRKKGDPIARLDPRDFEVALVQARAQHLQAKAQRLNCNRLPHRIDSVPSRHSSPRHAQSFAHGAGSDRWVLSLAYYACPSDEYAGRQGHPSLVNGSTKSCGTLQGGAAGHFGGRKPRCRPVLGLRLNGSVLVLPADPKYQNHFGAVHVSAQFSLAEAASGQWLLDKFGDAAADYLAVVRQVEIKYRRPANGELTAKTEVSSEEAERFRDTLERRGRASIEVRVRVFDAEENVTLEATFEWFAQGVRRGSSR